MTFMAQHEIRTLFSRAMSHMYQNEVPQYGTLLDIVKQVNQQYLHAHPDLQSLLSQTNELNRISEERHGAIRLGTAAELHTMRRLFAVMGMYPVSYYDLSIANIPVHSTAFRPITDGDLQKNPFRVFTSLLRTELITDYNTKKMAQDILEKRDIFPKKVRELITLNETQGGLTNKDAQEFVTQAIEIFRWHQNATISKAKYDALKRVHPLVADVVSFKGPHINHLTPRTLDIDQVQQDMPLRSLNPKAVIEGPPARQIPILLRQTSFKALEEAIQFPTGKGAYEASSHQARFGEIEQRGAALTPKGKALYEELLEKVREKITPNLDGSNADLYNQTLKEIFREFPDDLSQMRSEKLVYLNYYTTQKKISNINQVASFDLEGLIENGYVAFSPIIYEDFLPVSAAGIFTSNLGDNAPQTLGAVANQDEFEEALGAKVIDPFALYQAKEEASIKTIMQMFTLKR